MLKQKIGKATSLLIAIVLLAMSLPVTLLAHYDAPRRVNVTTSVNDFIGVLETARGTREWVVNFTAHAVYSDGSTTSFVTSFIVPHNNANVRGSYRFTGTHELAGFTLNFAVINNGANATVFTLFPTVGVEESMPHIRVLTPFPLARVTRNHLDIEYVAIPSEGEEIVKIYYTVNGNFHSYIFLAGGNGITPMGILGSARVFFMPGENTIEFTVVDTAGLTASFLVQQVIFFDEGFSPPNVNPGEVSWSGTHYYVNNRLMVTTVRSDTIPINEREIEDAFASVGGEIIGVVHILGMYIVGITKRCIDELFKLGYYLIDTFPHLFSRFSIDWVDDLDLPDITDMYDAEQNRESVGALMTPFRNTLPTGIHGNGTGVAANTTHPTNDPWWGASNEWGLTAIGMPTAWYLFGGQERQNVRIGIVDTGLLHTHEDMSRFELGYFLPASNVRYREDANKNHGTHVMGSIAAMHDNGLGLAGAINIARRNIFSYDSFDIREINPVTKEVTRRTSFAAQRIALAWLVARNVRVVNASLGSGGRPSQQRMDDFRSDMRELLNEGHDFVIVQSAGNERLEAGLTTRFA